MQDNQSVRCPRCGSRHVKQAQNFDYTCLACRSTFKVTPTLKKTTIPNGTIGVGPNKTKEATKTPFVSPEILSGEVIYKKCINGAACISFHSNGYTYSGSGFLINEYGHIITNAHVILDETGKASKDIKATIAGKTVECEVVKYEDPKEFDIAILKLKQMDYNFTPIALGDSSMVGIGERVYAIGNSLGEGLCFTCGIISDKDRMVENYRCFMADVATNHGNSGGPLLNEAGQVIAVCVAGIDGAQGMRYFIPINDVKARMF